MQRRLIAVICAAVLGLSCVFFHSSSVCAADSVEPGSPQAFYKWTFDTLDYVDTVLTSDNVVEWGEASVEYALNIRSMLVGYMVWLDNMAEQESSTVPYWGSASGYLRCKMPDDTYKKFYGVVSYSYGDLQSGSYPRYYSPGGMTFANVGQAGFIRTVSINNDNTNRIRLPYASMDDFIWYGTTYKRINASVGACNTSMVGTGIVRQDTGSSVNVWFSATDPYDLYSIFNSTTSTVNLVSSGTPQLGHRVPIQIKGNDDIVDLFNQIQSAYPDRENILPDITPPTRNQDYEQDTTEPETHPNGCHCEVHVHVTVTVENNFDSLLDGGNTLNSGVVDDLGVDPDAALSALDQLSFDAVESDSMKAGMGLFWAVFNKFTEGTGILSYMLACMLVLLLLWFFGRSV